MFWYSSGMWFGVAPRPDTNKAVGRLCVQNTITTLGWIVNIIEGDLHDHLMPQENMDFDNG